MDLKHGFISADDHVQEHANVWTTRLSKQKWGDRIPHIETQHDGAQHWIIDGAPIDLQEGCRADSTTARRAHHTVRWGEVPPAGSKPNERLQLMDADGVDYSILYPMVAGLAGERFGKLADADLELACVQAYNDWLIEEWASVSPRLVPQCIVPIWPIERTVAEIRRAVAMGHKGVIYPASPMELKDVPHINEPAYDPLWAVCAELGVPLCFHSGASPKIQMRAGENFTPAAALAFGGIVRSLSSIAVLANFLFSRVLYRFPKLQVVFAESSLGWAAYEIEYADYQSAADGLQSEGYALKPSELFQRQCFFTCWYDQQSLRVRKYPGSANILWSTHFPLEISTGPETRQRLDRAFAAVPDEEKRQIQWQNAAKLYGL
ncbi:MAG: Amidohydrolase [Deltaproteobacteria bacterium]|nr:Amidohydrolase [Deltaproteobacteria bacterium]